VISAVATTSVETSTPAARDGKSLLGWLRLLGWRVDIVHDDGQWFGTARRPGGSVGDLCVFRHGAGYRDVVSELYDGCLGSLALSAAA